MGNLAQRFSIKEGAVSDGGKLSLPLHHTHRRCEFQPEFEASTLSSKTEVELLLRVRGSYTQPRIFMASARRRMATM